MQVIRYRKRVIVGCTVFFILSMMRIFYGEDGQQVFRNKKREFYAKGNQIMTKYALLEEVNKNIQDQLKLDKGCGCETPRLDPFNPELLETPQTIPPCKGTYWVKCYMSECRVTKDVLEHTQDVQCWYRDIMFVDDFQYIIEKPTVVNGGEVYVLNASDYVKVKCTGRHNHSLFSTSWSGYGYGIRHTAPRRESPPGRQYTPSVLILGIDSVSKNEFIRQMPRTLKKLDELGAVILNKYNVLGDGTLAALFPLLTGKTELELPEARKGFKPKQYLDSFPWIFYTLAKDGYRTAYFEDRADIGTFQLRVRGWQKAPTDHYSRPLFSNYEYENTNFWWDWTDFKPMENCFGPEYTHRMMLNLTDQIWHLHGKKFALTWQVDLNHEAKYYLSSADSDFEGFLENFSNRGYLRNTFLILMSDHGNRYSKNRQFLQGKIEERLPFAALILPNDLQKTRPDALSNLQGNMDVLTTAHDLHTTILDVVGLPTHANPYKVNGTDLKRGISLLDKIPRSRSCSEAEILPHWCACVNWAELTAQDPMRRRAASALLDTINEITMPARQHCATRTLTSIEWVMIAMPRKRLTEYNGAADIDGLTAEFKKQNIKSLNDDYQVKIVTGPGNGVFEATLTFVKKKGKFSLSAKDISRTTKYGNEASCIISDLPHLSKFCYCVK